MKLGVRGLVAGALTLATLGLGGGVAQAQSPVVTVGADGKTAPVFDYTQAVRERVYIPQPGVDQDSNGETDFVTGETIRVDGGRHLK